MRLVALFLLAVPLLAQEEEGLAFDKDPVTCAPIECEVKVPTGWKVVQDHTGISVQGDGMGFVVTREPLLEIDKTFGESWARVLSNAGITAKVETTRAGRYKAFRAEWEPKEPAGRVVEVYRVHVEDQEMLYNISFSFPKDADRDPLLKGVLKSFKCTADKPKLELQEQRVAIGGSATIQLPEGFEAKQHPRIRAGYYVKARRGYATPQEAGVIYLFETDPRGRPEETNQSLIPQLVQLGLKFGAEFKIKDATYAGFKGEGRTGTVQGTEGETYEAYVWTGKNKRSQVTVVLVIHEREMRLYGKYFSTVLKSLKVAK